MKVAIIIADQDFQDQEYMQTKNVLELKGIKTKTVSFKKGKAIGKFGNEVKINFTTEELDVLEFDAIIFIGGPGAGAYIENEMCHTIARDAVENNKVLAAICIAPAILAKAGVLKGKIATVWSSSMDKSAIKILKENGALYKDDSVVCDGNIITANGPESSYNFGLKISEVLTLK